MKHTSTYQALPSGAGKLVCSCGWESPAIDAADDFTLGRKQKPLDQYFEEHLATVETQMATPATEHAVAPAQRPQTKKKR